MRPYTSNVKPYTSNSLPAAIREVRRCRNLIVHLDKVIGELADRERRIEKVLTLPPSPSPTAAAAAGGQA